MNILYISYDGLTDSLGQSQILPYLIGCAKEHRFAIISFEKSSNLQNHQKEIQERVDLHSMKWIPLSYTKNPPLFSTLFDIKRMERMILKVIESNNIELLHCRSYVTAYAAFNVKKKTDVKLLFDIRGFWADERIDGEIWSLKNPIERMIYKRLKKLETEWFKKADAVISLTETAKQFINSDKVHVIPCCADEDHFNKDNISSSKYEEYRKSMNYSMSDRILGYIGSIGTWYLSKEMMLQFKHLSDKGLVDKFLWVTGEHESKIMELAKEYDVNPDLVSVVKSPRWEVPCYLNIMDVGIFYIKKTFSKKASSPTKLGELLLMGKPVITNEGIGDLDDFFKKNKVGICHSINHLVTPNEFNELKSIPSNNIREIGLRELSLSKGIKKYLEVYSTLND